MPRLPSARDVPTVRQQSDPGINVPSGAFDTNLGIATEALVPAAVTLQKVAIKRQNREDTIDRSDRINQFNRTVTDEFRRVNNEEDFSKTEVATNFGKFMSDQLAQLGGEHGGSPESQALLRVRMQDIQGDFQGKAAVVSATLGRQKVLTTFNYTLKVSIDRVQGDPTHETIKAELLNVRTTVNDLRGAFDPGQEEELFAAGQEIVAIASLDATLARGRFEEADALLDTTLANTLSPDKLLAQRRKIGTATGSKSTLEQNIDTANAALRAENRPELTADQVLAKVGFEDNRKIMFAVAPDGNRTSVFTDGEGNFFDIENNKPIKLAKGTQIFPQTQATTSLPGNIRGIAATTKITAANLVGTAQDVLDLLDENPDINTFAASTAAFTNDMQQEGMALARSLGKTWEPDVFEPEQYSSIFDKLGVKRREFQSVMVSLAFQAAAASGQEARSVSDKDIERFLKEIGSVSEDPRGIAVAIRGLVKRTKRNLQNTLAIIEPGTTFPALPVLRSSFFDDGDGASAGTRGELAPGITIQDIDLSHKPPGVSDEEFLELIPFMDEETQKLLLKNKDAE